MAAARETESCGTGASQCSNNDVIPGYEKVSYPGIKEDIHRSLSAKYLKKSNKKLVLVQVPTGFDVSGLSGKTIVLNGNQRIKGSKKDDGGRYEINSTLDDQLKMYSVVSPSTSTNSLQRVQPVSGHMQVFKSWRVPPVNQECAFDDEMTADDHIYQMNWKPFGSRSPKSIRSKKRKRTDTDDDSIEIPVTNIKQEPNLEADSTNEMCSPRRKKKKKKRQQEDIKIEIKTEPGL